MAARRYTDPGTIGKGDIFAAECWNRNVVDNLGALHDRTATNETALAALEANAESSGGARPDIPTIERDDRGLVGVLNDEGEIEFQRHYEVVNLIAGAAFPFNHSGASINVRTTWRDDQGTQRTIPSSIWWDGTSRPAVHWQILVPTRVVNGETAKVRAHIFLERTQNVDASCAMRLEWARVAYSGSRDQQNWQSLGNIFDGSITSIASTGNWPGVEQELEFEMPNPGNTRYMAFRVRMIEEVGSVLFGLSSMLLYLPVDLTNTGRVVTPLSATDPPGPIRSLALATSSASIVASWLAPNTGGAAFNYRVERSVDGSAWVLVATTSSLSRAITGLTNGTEYYIRVRAQNNVGNSSWVSARATPTATATQLSAPTVTLTPALTSIAAAWQAITNASSYQIRWVTGASAPTGAWTTVNGTSYTISNLMNGTQYTVQVRAVGTGAFITSAPREVSATTTSPVSNKLATPSLSIDATATTLIVTWSAVANASSYRIRYRQGLNQGVFGSWTIVNGLMHTITGLTANTEYLVQVQARSSSTFTDSDFGELPFQTLASASSSISIVVTSRGTGNPSTNTRVVFTASGVERPIEWQAQFFRNGAWANFNPQISAEDLSVQLQFQTALNLTVRIRARKGTNAWSDWVTSSP